MIVHAKKRTFEDPKVLGLKQSAWTAWHLTAPQFFRGRARTGGTSGRGAQADPVALAKALAELGVQ